MRVHDGRQWARVPCEPPCQEEVPGCPVGIGDRRVAERGEGGSRANSATTCHARTKGWTRRSGVILGVESRGNLAQGETVCSKGWQLLDWKSPRIIPHVASPGLQAAGPYLDGSPRADAA